jgi:hypothetical protein
MMANEFDTSIIESWVTSLVFKSSN